MKIRKLFPFLLTAVLLFSTLISVNPVLADVQNFGSWTEVDPNSRITITSSRITWASLTRDEDAYVYKDKGVDYFSGNFEFQLTHRSTAGDSAGTGKLSIWALANTVDDYRGIDTANGSEITIYIGTGLAGTPYFGLSELDSGTEYSAASVYYGVLNTNYYLTIKRVEQIGNYGTAYCYIYSDSARTNLLSTLSLALHSSKKDFRYLYAMQSWDTDTPTFTHSGYIENLDIVTLTVGEPAVTTLAASDINYDSFFNYFLATLSGNVTDDGGEPCQVGFFYRIQGSADWSASGAEPAYASSGEVFYINLAALQALTTYEYKAYAINSANTTYGSLLTFYTGYFVGLPVITTWGYPLQKGIDWAKFYGEVTADGSSNVTAWFQYREQGSSTWLNSANTTLNLTGAQFSANVTGFLETHSYEFRAAGLNNTGTAYGGIVQFTMYPPLTVPIITTLPATLVTENSAWIWAYLDDDGGKTCFVYFRWREAGTSVWSQTAQFASVTTNMTRGVKISGLTSGKSYEYQAIAWNGNVYEPAYEFYGYGEILTLTPFAQIRIPVMVTGNSTFLDASAVSAIATVQFDGGSDVAVWLRYRLTYTATWLVSDKVYGITTGYETSIIMFNLEAARYYEYQAVGENTQGIGYGAIKTFGVIPPSVPGVTPPTSLLDLVNQLRANLGLIGIFGTWAFMGLVILVLSLLFGIAMVAVEGHIQKLAIAVAWLISSIAVVGAFIFTGQLGIWPLIILIIAVVSVILIFVSSRLSGGGVSG